MGVYLNIIFLALPNDKIPNVDDLLCLSGEDLYYFG